MVECDIAPRRFINLVSRLPDDSVYRTLRAHGEEFVGWGADRIHNALILEQLIFQRFEFAQANSEKKLKPPEPLPLPGRKSKKEEAAANNPFAAMLERERAFVNDSPAASQD